MIFSHKNPFSYFNHLQSSASLIPWYLSSQLFAPVSAVSPAVQSHSLSVAASADTWGEAGPKAAQRQQKYTGVPEIKTN